MMMSCKAATRLASEAMDRKLSLVEQMQLRLHLAICNGCRNFTRQIDLLRHAGRNLPDHFNGDE